MALLRDHIAPPRIANHRKHGCVRIICFFAAVAAGLSIVGCQRAQRYVEPLFLTGSYQRIEPVDGPQPVTIDVEFHRLGIRWRHIEYMLQPKVARILTAPGVFEEADDANSGHAGHILVAVNHNIRPTFVATEIGKRMGVVFTGGLLGQHSVEPFEVVVTYTPPDGPVASQGYEHAVHTVVGPSSLPEGAKLVHSRDLPDQMMDDVLVTFLCHFRENESGALAAAPDTSREPAQRGDGITAAATTSAVDTKASRTDTASWPVTGYESISR